MARNPQLQSIPQNLKADVKDLVLHGSASMIATRASRPVADPVMFPTMALSAVLDADLVGDIVWVFPSKGTQADIDFRTFRKQLLESGSASETELKGFRQTEQTITGTLRGHRFTMATFGQLPVLDEPVLLHFDLGFFAPFYRHEIGTPLYPLVFETLKKLRKARWSAQAVTVSPSNLSGELPLDSRFLARDLAVLFRKPGRLDEPVPREWIKRGQALYLENFIQRDKILQNYQELEKRFPKDASIKYGLYQIERERKEGEVALAYLEQAVALDSVYGLAYLNLADSAEKAKRPDAVLQMFDKAIALFPDNPFIPLRKAEFLARVGRPDIARPILARLKALTWSKVYFPRMPAYLENLSQAKQQGKSSDDSKKD
jgi:hypothetical protein